MIRRPDDFPDVDRVIEEAGRPPAVLDYRGRDPRDESKGAPARQYLRRIAFAVGLAALCGGLGASIRPRDGGAAWMAFGGGVVGLVLPLRATEVGE